MPFLLGFVNYVFHVHFLNVLCFGCIFIIHFFFMHFYSGIGAFVRPDLSNECAIPNILKALRFRLHFHCVFLFPCISKQAFNKCPFSTGAFVRPDLSNECAIPNILKALRFRLHFHCIFLFPCISKRAFNKCPFSTHEMCSSCHLANHFFPQPFFGSTAVVLSRPVRHNIRVHVHVRLKR